MKLIVLAIGRLKEDYLQAAEAEYVKRLRPYVGLDLREVADERALLAAIPRPAILVALDERGALLSSEAFARDVVGHAAMHGGGKPLVLAIGGPDGHGPAVR